MANSEVEICNSALVKLGAQRLLSLDDNNERARICKEQYAILRDELLYAHPWNFAIGRVELAEVLPAPEFGFAHKFQLPTDCLRVLEVDGFKNEEWEVEGRFLQSHYSTAKIKYIKRITDVSKFTPGFAEVLASKIAADICFSITQSVSLRDQMQKAYDKALAYTRSFDAQESQGARVYADSWLNARN